MKLKISVVTLTSCSGCISTMMSLDIFPQYLERTTFNYFPFISDSEEIEDCDITLVEGCVSKDSEVNLLKNIRKHSKKVYALGTCAAFGGILSLSIKQSAKPISNFIEIDGIIPGCPPPSKLLGNSIIRLIDNKNLELLERTLCATCPLKGTFELSPDMNITRILPEPNEIVPLEEKSECFLKQGILCLGPITRDGCELKCLKLGFPCEGCMGPVSKDFTSNVVNFLSLINISRNLKKNKSVFYRFSKPLLRGW